jgi:hypothetical protein
MIINGPIECFFKNPDSELSSEGDGILFHLRRDLVKLIGAEGQRLRDAPPHVMMSLMGTLAGIDYLSQVYSAEDGSRKRFVETVRELCNMSEEESEALYQLRCAIVHSVALSTISSSYRKGVMFIFEITDSETCPLIEKQSDNSDEVAYRIGFWVLRETFLNIIAKLEDIARDLEDPKNAYVINMIGEKHSEKILKTK